VLKGIQPEFLLSKEEMSVFPLRFDNFSTVETSVAEISKKARFVSASLVSSEPLFRFFAWFKGQVAPPQPFLLHRRRRAPVAAGAVAEVEEPVWVELLDKDPDEVDETVELLVKDPDEVDETVGLVAKDPDEVDETVELLVKDPD